MTKPNTDTSGTKTHNTVLPVSKRLSAAVLGLGLTGLVLAVIIMLEKLALLADPNHVTSCSFNPIVSCSPVMSSPQAEILFNIPNPVLGIIGFTVISFFGFINLFTTVPKKIWHVMTAGTGAALVFCFWLASQALFEIQALCLYCCGVWVVTSVLFWLFSSQSLKTTQHETLGAFSPVAATATVLAFAVMVFVAFQTFWLSLLS